MAEKERELYQRLSEQLKLSPDKIKSSAQSGDVDGLTSRLDGDKAKQVKDILSDPDRAREILNSPQAKALIKLLNES